MTEFERKRLQYFVKAALKGEWVRLGKGDADVFLALLDSYDELEDIIKEDKEIIKEMERL